MGHDPDVYWDGGYEDMVDSGEGIEHLYIGPEQAYDIETGHIPAEGFETRPELPRRRPADDVEAVEVRVAQAPPPHDLNVIARSKRRGKEQEPHATVKIQRLRANPAVITTKGEPPQRTKAKFTIVSTPPIDQDVVKPQEQSNVVAMTRTASAIGLDHFEIRRVLDGQLVNIGRDSTQKKAISDLIRSLYLLCFFPCDSTRCREAQQEIIRITRLHPHLPNKKLKRNDRSVLIAYTALLCDLRYRQVKDILSGKASTTTKSDPSPWNDDELSLVLAVHSELTMSRKFAFNGDHGQASEKSSAKKPLRQAVVAKPVSGNRENTEPTSIVHTPNRYRNRSRRIHRASHVNWIGAQPSGVQTPPKRPSTPNRAIGRESVDLVPVTQAPAPRETRPIDICMACDQPIISDSLCGCS